MESIIEWIVDIALDLMEASVNDQTVEQRISKWVRSGVFGVVWLLV